MAEIRKQKDSRLQKWWWMFTVPLLVGLMLSGVNSLVDFYVKERLAHAGSPQESTKVVKEEARKAVEDVRELEDYRFVSIGFGKTLAVRSSAGARASVVGQLRFGQAVYVVEKRTDFTLIEWRSEDGAAVLRGWVFSRYLRRFS